MSKKQNYNIGLIGEGYDDLISKRLQEEKEKIKKEEEEINNPHLNILTTRNIVILAVWAFLYKLFIKYEFGLVYLMLSIIVFIFTNLGKREAWQLSAYSVFNPNFERLPGTFTVNDIAAGMGISGLNPNSQDNENEDNIQDVVNSTQVASLNGNNLSRDNLVNKRLSKYELWKKEQKGKAKLPLKSPCPCGSGKKYKNCCLLKEE